MTPPATPVVDALDLTSWVTAAVLVAAHLAVSVMAGLGLRSERHPRRPGRHPRG